MYRDNLEIHSVAINEFPKQLTSDVCKTLDSIFRSSFCKTNNATILIYSILTWLLIIKSHMSKCFGDLVIQLYNMTLSKTTHNF